MRKFFKAAILFWRIGPDGILRMNDQLEELKAHDLQDPLTWLYNRRFLDDFWQRESSRSFRRKIPASVSAVYLDIDNLKDFNDRKGHLIGDQLLIMFGQILRSCCRSLDIIARTGGDEFVIIMTNTDEAGAEHVVKRIEDQALVKGISFSYGICFSSAITTVSLADCLNEADKRMYKNKELKKAGR